MLGIVGWCASMDRFGIFPLCCGFTLFKLNYWWRFCLEISLVVGSGVGGLLEFFTLADEYILGGLLSVISGVTPTLGFGASFMRCFLGFFVA